MFSKKFNEKAQFSNFISSINSISSTKACSAKLEISSTLNFLTIDIYIYLLIICLCLCCYYYFVDSLFMFVLFMFVLLFIDSLLMFVLFYVCVVEIVCFTFDNFFNIFTFSI